jgi:Protein of unknown function (DUF3135)
MELPDFDSLVTLAEKHPEKLEALRHQYNQHIINAAPDSLRKKLEGLLFKIDMEKRRSKNPTQCCIKLSELMMDSFFDMQTTVRNLRSNRVSKKSIISDDLDNIINFPVKDKSEQA